MDILYQRKWYAGWYSYTNFINTYLNAGALSNYPLWVADYRSRLGYQGSYTMWQYSGSGTCDGVTGAVDLDYSYTDFLPAIREGGFNNYGPSGPDMVSVSGYLLNVFGSQTEYFYTANVNDIVGYLPPGHLPGHQDQPQQVRGVRLGHFPLQRRGNTGPRFWATATSWRPSPAAVRQTPASRAATTPNKCRRCAEGWLFPPPDGLTTRIWCVIITHIDAGFSSSGRVTASQAVGGEFETRNPLHPSTVQQTCTVLFFFDFVVSIRFFFVRPPLRGRIPRPWLRRTKQQPRK